MTDEFKSDRVAFEPFGTLEGVLNGQPFRIFPEGKWYRDNRTLDITPERLKEFADNVKAGLPRFRIPINLDHSKESGKVGTVHDVDYMPKGPEGPGLYATKYELTDKGQKAIKEDGYDAVSGEAVWTLFDGSKYQDPNTGKKHDNVLAGVALTPTPFFGHGEVALFSAMPMPDTEDKPRRGNGYTKLRETMKTKFAELLAMFEDKDGDGEPDPTPTEVTPTHRKVDAPAEFSNSNPPPTTPVADYPKGQENMADPITTPAPPAPETFSVSAEEFAAIKAKAEQADKLTEQFQALQKQNETFAAQLRDTQRARRNDQLVDKYSAFSGGKAEDVAALLLELEETNKALADKFTAVIDHLDTLVKQGQMFAQISNGRAKPGADTFTALVDRIHKDKFSADPEKYVDAMNAAQKERPDLFAEYYNGGKE